MLLETWREMQKIIMAMDEFAQLMKKSIAKLKISAPNYIQNITNNKIERKGNQSVKERCVATDYELLYLVKQKSYYESTMRAS